MSVFASQANSLDLLRQMELDAEPHHYYTKAPRDRFTRLQKEINAGKVVLDRSSEKAFVTSLLRALEIPASSQMLVFSTTSLQLSLITPANPRALYFNEDTYLGFIPGGKVEIVSIDPDLGGIFYIMDIPRGGNSPLTIDRSRRCMNCHSGSETGYVPGLTIKSVVPGTRGGSIESFRTDVTGHEIPLSERFGGWYLTGATGFTNWANAIGRMAQGELSKELLTPGERFSWSKYLVESSDLLPQMIHEHQAGFVNRAAQAAYIERIYRHQQQGKEMTANQTAEIERSAEELVKYVLFANEAALPPGGIKGDQAFKQDFLVNRKITNNGTSLRDFELNERIFRFRCSYMVYSEQFATLPKGVKGAVMNGLKQALQGESKTFAHIPTEEKQAIRSILTETLPGFN